MTHPDASANLAINPAPDTSAEAYARDFYAWTVAQVAALRRESLAGLDIPHLIEEIDSLGRAQINALRSRYFRLCVSLLKLAYQPDKASRSWRGTVSHQRIEIARLFKDSPGLTSKRQTLFAEAYDDARRQAVVETGLATDILADAPPFTLEQAEMETWLPEPARPSV